MIPVSLDDFESHSVLVCSDKRNERSIVWSDVGRKHYVCLLLVLTLGPIFLAKTRLFRLIACGRGFKAGPGRALQASFLSSFILARKLLFNTSYKCWTCSISSATLGTLGITYAWELYERNITNKKLHKVIYKGISMAIFHAQFH